VEDGWVSDILASIKTTGLCPFAIKKSTSYCSLFFIKCFIKLKNSQNPFCPNVYYGLSSYLLAYVRPTITADPGGRIVLTRKAQPENWRSQFVTSRETHNFMGVPMAKRQLSDTRNW